MTPRADKLMQVERRSQLDALVSPLRQEILEELKARGPASVADLAQRLGRKPQSLHHHVNRLAAAKIVTERDRRRKGRHSEVVWQVAATKFAVDPKQITPGMGEAIVRSVSALLRRAQRNFARAVRSGKLSDASGKPCALALYG